MPTLSRPAAMIMALSLLASAAAVRAQPTTNDAPPGRQVDMDDLRELVRTLRQERQAHYGRSRERAGKIEDTLAACGKLESALADLRAREAELDRTLAEVRSDIDRLEQERERNVVWQTKLAARVDRVIGHVTDMVERGIPYRVEERLARLHGEADALAPPDEVHVADVFARLWSFFREEMRIAGSGEAYTAEIALDERRRKHCRVFRVGHQVLGYLTEDGTETGLWFHGSDGGEWKHDLAEAQSESVRTAVSILDRLRRPQYVSLPVRSAPAVSSRPEDNSEGDDARETR